MKKSYTTIYHISDIHIRLFSRRQEYQLVFEKLYALLRSKKNLDTAALVVTGDLLHNKIDLQPECTMLTYEFLRELGSILPTIVIAGNHDALLNNRDRIDSLTSILHDRHPPNVHYYTKTGVYRHDNLVFIVNSLLDDQWIRASDIARENPTDVLVGLYHGQINGWKNCHGYVSETGEKEVSDFEGCDYVMLGDIHKHQYMNKEKTMAYAGSLLSQNFGETDDDHGVLEWDLVHGTSQLFRLPNDYAYKEFRVMEGPDGLSLTDGTNGIAAPLLEAPVPPKGNVKVFLPPGHDLSVSSVIRKAYPGARFQFQALTPQSTTTHGERQEIAVAHEVEDEMLITEYIRQRWPQEKAELRKRLQNDLLQDFYANRLGAGSTTGWQLEYLYFENLFGYGAGNRIDLETLPRHTVTGIFGKNSAGKSTLIDIVAFMLYGKITRSSHGNTIPKEVIHFGEKSGWGELGMRLGSKRYVLRKVCTRHLDKIKIVQTLFEVDDGGNRSQLTDEQRKKTDKVVEGMIGGFKTFVYTNLFLQQREESFRDMKQASRKDFLYELFGLDLFEKYRKTKEEEWKAARAEESSLRKRIEHRSQEMWETELQTVSVACNTLQANLTATKNSLTSLDRQREACLEKLKPCTQPSLDALRAKKKELEAVETECASETSKALRKKEACTLFLAQHNLEELQAKMTSRASATAPSGDDVDEDETGLIRKHSPYHSNQSYKEWTALYQGVQASVASSAERTREWTQKEAVYLEEIRALQAGKPSFDPSCLLPETREWSAWTQEYEAQSAQHARDTEEWGRLEEAVESGVSTDMEAVLVQLEKTVQDLTGVQCRYEVVRQQIRTDEGIVFNKACTSCMSNPHYLQRKELSVEGKRLKARLTALEVKCRELWLRLPMDSTPASACWGDALEAVRGVFHKKRRRQQESCTRKQQILDARKEFAAFENRYKNTAAARRAKKADLKIARLEKQRDADPVREAYTRMVKDVGNLSVYTRLEEMWKESLEKGGGVSSLQDTVLKCQRHHKTVEELNHKLEDLSERTLRCRVSLETLRVEETWWVDNESIHLQIQKYEARKSKTERQLLETEDQWREQERQRATLAAQHEQWRLDKEAYDRIVVASRYLELLVSTTERDGLPLFLLKRKLPVIEADVNTLLSPFLEKRLVLCVEDKDVVVGIETLAESGKVSNYLGGMESFLVDLSLKLGFSKFANLPRSNLFIIDEGISVLDQERISNISHLFDFLANITDHVLLISHLPTIKDFVHQSIEVLKDEATQKSRLVMG